MTITAEQTVAISAELSVDLATVTDDRLIELCLLYRSAPEALPTFPDLLRAEITRRFTAAEIAANDVMFSVIQNFSNNFDPELQYKEKLYEFVNALNRELWINQNITFFENLITVTDRVTWAVNNSDVMTAVAASSAAMTIIAASSTAMAAITSSSAAMAIIATSSVALSAIVKSATARTILESDSAILKGVRTTIYATIKASWTKSVGISQSASPGTVLLTINSAVASPAGFCISTLGYVSISYSDAVVVVTKANGVQETYPTTSLNPTSITSSYFIGLNGAKFTCGSVYNRDCSVYAELWIPPA